MRHAMCRMYQGCREIRGNSRSLLLDALKARNRLSMHVPAQFTGPHCCMIASGGVMASRLDPNVNIPISDDEGTSEKRALINKEHSSGQRWVILFLGSAVALINGFQNLQFAGCEAQVVSYFQVIFELGDLLTQAYYISFVLLAFPVMWLIMKRGLRFTVHCAAALALTATIMTAVSVTHRRLYAMALASEFVAGASQVFILCYPSMLAGTWFPPEDVSSASGTVVFFYQLGNGLALLIPPFVVKEPDLGKTMGLGAVALFSSLVGFALIVYLLTKFYFADDPPHRFAVENYVSSRQSANNLCRRDFILLTFSYGIDVGIISAQTSVFKSVLADDFPDISDVVTGQIVACMVLTGTAAPIIFGVVLDKTKKFICTLLFIHVICIVSTLILVFAMRYKKLWLVWFGSVLFGLGFTGKMSVGLEAAAEITRPERESTSSGILMWSMSVFTIIFIQAMRFFLKISNTYVNVLLASCSGVSLVFTCFMRSDLRRSQAVYEELKDEPEASE